MPSRKSSFVLKSLPFKTNFLTICCMLLQFSLPCRVSELSRACLIICQSTFFPLPFQCTPSSRRCTLIAMCTHLLGSSSFMFWKESLLRENFHLTPNLVCPQWGEKVIDLLNFSFCSMCTI